MHASSHLEAIRIARLELERRPVYLDTETTGLNPTDQVVEICVLDHDGRVLVESLVRPTCRISPNARQVHGITDAMVKTAPTWSELWPAVRKSLAGRRVAIYNARFDVDMMRQSHGAHHLAWRAEEIQTFCVMQLYASFLGQWDSRRGSFRWHRLEEAGRQCNIPLPNSHRAKDDALLARAVLLVMGQRAG